MHFTHFSNALHTFLFHLTGRLLYLYTVFLHYITHTYTQHAHIYPIIFIQGFVKHCISSSSNVVFSWALHFSQALHCIFSLKDVSVIFISCLVSVVLDLHCIFFPWTWSFFSFHFGVLVSCFVAVVVLLFDWSFERKWEWDSFLGMSENDSLYPYYS